MPITNDGDPEDYETVIIKLRNAIVVPPEGVALEDLDGVILLNPDGTSAEGADATGRLVIRDNEPDIKIVTITSYGEAMPGDYFFVVVAASAVTSASADGTLLTPLLDPAEVPEILRNMLDLNEVRSKPTTGIALGMVPDSEADITVTAGSLQTTLNVVGERTNRNFFLFEGMNFTGLALVPNEDNDTFEELLPANTVPNANPDLIEDLKALNPDNIKLDRDIVTLEHMVWTVFAWEFDLNGGFDEYHLPHPVTGGGADSRLVANTDPTKLTKLMPFQGMLIRTRPYADVPVKMTVHGRFMEEDGPISQQLRNKFNLIAPQIWADTPFETVFGGTGLEPEVRFGAAITRKREVVVNAADSAIGADIFERWVTEFVDGGIIEAEFAYWVHMADTNLDVFLIATGPNSVSME